MVNQLVKVLDIVKIAFEAGKHILDVYHSDSVEVDYKNDASPVTIADKKSHHSICQQLSIQYPNIPLISEEGDLPNYQQRKHWHTAWLIDPLDGTKEFIKRNGEFTVNIALIEKGTPILGVIYSPAQDLMYFASSWHGSYKLSNCRATLSTIYSEAELIKAAEKLPIFHSRKSLGIVVSRSHFSSDTQAYIDQIQQQVGDVHIIKAGSSIKMCLIAEGVAHIYPRLSYSMEWDTAAGEAIVTYSGGKVEEYGTHSPLQYNKVHLKNSFHIVTAQSNDNLNIR
ncbi:3'(2'),5'-bisphosphate nucleotidase CysQ [Solibacillus cecembensis]|uniref:3'(2'),5'-bisphosphate nucleotidase CysQ n=1 Tax=Solibacillus cecembensis TaxID=459347 RepID=UPI000716F6B0